eukprot:TRINITY_DN5645_c0_g1_i16.p1 TRINITY_DN5645_c0_g1~~TRINITY_DN5645_c0_g1_i16.p1  ORF type:complete len:264 (+),score=46.58 TRINITY_DN5645_c0_g1_i16:459-1250(+)
MNKVESARNSVLSLNPFIKCTAHPTCLTKENAKEISSPYQIIVDCSDNLPTRYLVNDLCVLTMKPLVSGSAIGFEGQVSVYNYGEGPCYRCINPKPLSINLTSNNCSNYGVLGVVPGIIGCFQALEVIKIVTQFSAPSSQKLILFDARETKLHSVKLPGKNKNCSICSTNKTIFDFVDYQQFCGSSPTDKIVAKQVIPSELNICPVDYKKILEDGEKHVLLDVRVENEFSICHLPNALSLFFPSFPSGIQNCYFFAHAFSSCN